MKDSEKVILDLCGGTGAWSRPYKEAGYDVRLITLPEYDVRTYRPHFKSVYGILMAVDCTHFTVSGAQYWHSKDMDGRTLQAILVVKSCLEIKDYYESRGLVFWSLENPIGRIQKLVPEIGDVAFKFDPCDFGDAWTKRTYLYGRFSLPEKHPVEPVKVCAEGSWLMQLGGTSVKTKTLRAITPPGFARAFFEANR